MAADLWFAARDFGGKCERGSATVAPATRLLRWVSATCAAALAPGPALRAGGVQRGVFGLRGNSDALND